VKGWRKGFWMPDLLPNASHCLFESNKASFFLYQFSKSAN
jgi:hypothetical protein